MPRLLRIQAVTVVFLLMGTSALMAFWGHKHDDPQKLQAQIQREHNPVKKAKLGVRLAKVRLRQAISAYESGKINRGEHLLTSYVEVMNDSWETLRNSGRHALKQPQGFKELDIALREGNRKLNDLKHRVLYSNRGPVDKAAQDATQIRNQVLNALFPPENIKGANRSARRHRSSLENKGPML